MALEWDEEKREATSSSTGSIFATSTFDEPTVKVLNGRQGYGETRIHCLGEIKSRIFAHTWRGPYRRIISARRANARERKTYYARVER
jgi:uncharacterized protein